MLNSPWKTRATIAGVVVAVVTLVATIGYLFWVYLQPQADIEIDSLCPADPGSLAGINVVLIDRTEPFTEIQQEDILNRLTQVIDKSKANEQFVIYEISARRDMDIQPELKMCNPGKNEGVFASHLERARHDEFKAAIENVLRAAMPEHEEADSPIMEMIQAAAVRHFKNAPEKLPKRLLIVSDMMQHSQGFSQYRSNITPSQFFSSRFYKSVEVPLDNVQVDILYVTRFNGSSAQAKGHRIFWAKYFTRQHAQFVTLEQINGAAWITEEQHND